MTTTLFRNPSWRARLGMKAYELSKNEQLEEYRVTDLNVNAKFPFEDSSFDVVTCVVSVSKDVRQRTARRGSICFFHVLVGPGKGRCTGQINRLN